jgi:hypothetical protein
MEAQGAARRGVGTIPRRGGRRRLEALLTVAAVLVIVAVMALMTRGTVAPATGGVGAQDAVAGVGSTIVHDDAGNMPLGTGLVLVHDDAGNIPATGAGASAAVVHGDAGNVR